MTVRVLVIDDDHAVRRAFVDAVSAMGYEVDGAVNGLQGVALFAKRQHDVVVTDVRMPGLHGWDVVRAVRRLRRDVGLIVLCGGDTDVAEAEGDVGDLDRLVVLVKPVALDQLRDALARVVSAKPDRL